MAGAFALVAIMGPDQFIRMRRNAREREYREGFPDLLDLLVASVQAGLSLDAAVGRITEELARRYPNLTEHLMLMTLELRAGRAAQGRLEPPGRPAGHRRGASPSPPCCARPRTWAPASATR